MAQKSKQISLVVVVILAGLGFWAWRRSVERSIPLVRIQKVSRQDIHTGVTTSGKAEPVAIRELRAELGGTVSRLLVKVGDKVRAGDTIAEVSVPGLQTEAAQAAAELAAANDARRLAVAGGSPAQLAELQAQVDQARRVREQAETVLKQSERLAEKGAIARVELEQARQAFNRAGDDLSLAEKRWNLRSDPEAVKQADARIKAAQAAFDLAETRSRKTAVRASISGVVYSLPVRVGDFVEPNVVVARIGDVSRLNVRVFVDEPDLGKISLGQEVHIAWDGLPDKSWTGTVERTPAEVENRDSRTGGEVLASVDNSSGELLPSTNLTVEIITASRKGVLAIPREALEIDGIGRVVWVPAGENAQTRNVETGIMNPTSIEIVKGLAEGDEVIVRGDHKLSEGIRIRRATP
jgi:HlyD family secretion protein